MLSGGIDSPVAAYMLLKNSYEVVGLHMDNRPFTDDTMLWKVKQHVKILEKMSVSYTHLRAHETRHDLVCRLLLVRFSLCVVGSAKRKKERKKKLHSTCLFFFHLKTVE